MPCSTGTIKLDKWASKSSKVLPRLWWHAPPVVGSWAEIIANNHYLAAYTQRPFHVLQYAYEATQTADVIERDLKQYLQQGQHGSVDTRTGRRVDMDAVRAQQSTLKKEARDRFLLSGVLFEQSSQLRLNGSRVLPDFYFRNWGVAYSQLLGLEDSPEAVAAAKQRAAAGFLKYLSFNISDDDRRTIEDGVISLIPPPASMQVRHLPTPHRSP